MMTAALLEFYLSKLKARGAKTFLRSKRVRLVQINKAKVMLIRLCLAEP